MQTTATTAHNLADAMAIIMQAVEMLDPQRTARKAGTFRLGVTADGHIVVEATGGTLRTADFGATLSAVCLPA